MKTEKLVYWTETAGQPNVLRFPLGWKHKKHGSLTQCSAYFPETKMKNPEYCVLKKNIAFSLLIYLIISNCSLISKQCVQYIWKVWKE